MNSNPSGVLEKLKPIESVCRNSRLRYAFLYNTSISFLVSKPLFQYLYSHDPPSKHLIKQFEAEIRRIWSLGFGTLETLSKKKSESIQEISLHLTHGCNLACNYCNVQQGTYGEKESLMDKQTASAAIDFLSRSGCRKSPTLVLYGGEPLINWPVLEAAVHKMKKTFGESDIKVVTNGTLLNNERAVFFAKNDVFTIISIDGPKEIHDHNRPTTGNCSSYDKVVKGLEYLKKAGARFHVRGTWVPGTGNYETILGYLAEMVGDRRLVTLGLCFEYANTASEYNNSLKILFDSARKDIRLFPSVSFPYVDRILRPGIAGLDTCSAGRTGFSITPLGDIYPCQVSVSLKKYKAGDVYNGINKSGQKVLEDFLNISSSKCKTCWAQVYCSGPCPYAVPFPDDWPYCDTVKLQIREALAFCVETQPDTLLEFYHRSSTGSIPIRRYKQIFALRDLLWKSNHHIKPLSICPQGRGAS